MTREEAGWAEDQACRVNVTEEGKPDAVSGWKDLWIGEDLFKKYLNDYHRNPVRITLEVWGESSPIVIRDYTSHQNKHTNNSIEW